MNRFPPILAVTLAACLALSACRSGDDEPPQSITQVARQAISEVRTELATQNIELGKGKDGQAKAELSPNGDLIIDGKPVVLTADQRARVLEFRGHLAALAEGGAEVGLQGAALATEAMTEAARGLVRGETAEAGKQIEAKADKIKAAAQKLCDRLPALLEAQQRLVEALPEFAPYANMGEDDVRDCRTD